MKKVLAIIGGGSKAEYYAEACKRLGYESHYFSLADGKIPAECSAEFHEINIFDKDKIVEICKEIKADGVVSTTELTVPVTAYVADKLGVLGIPVDVANVITDKYRNRNCISNLDTLQSPKYSIASSPEDVKKAKIPFPIILKPVNLGGKRGLTVVKTPEELENAFKYAKEFQKKLDKPIVIAEQFLEGGQEYSVESISYKGQHNIIQITQKDSGGPPHCVELGHHQPANLSKDLWDKVVKSISEGLTAIGLTNGACHTEIKIIDEKIYLIEFNARPGGGHISHPLVLLSTGFDYMAALAQAAVGDLPEIDSSKFKNRYSGLYYVVAQTDYLKPIFDICQKEHWCYKKHFVSNELKEYTKNDLPNTNYFIYASDQGDPVESILTKKL